MRLSELNDSTLADMEAHIRSIYEEAWEELHDIEAEYWEDFQIRDAEMQAAIEDGTYPIPDGYTPEQYYAQWRINQIGRDDRWIALRERMASRMVNADSVAASYINDTTPGIYTLNANYTAYTIEQLANSHDLGNGASAGGIAFDIVDEQTVKRLITEDVQLFPAPKIDIPKDMQWNRDALQRCLVSNILQGKSISAIAKGFQFVTGMDQNSAIRSARTAVTGAQNAGRVASYNQAEAMGIEMEMQWMCTLDDRTRSAHQQLDGVRVKPKDKFSGHGLQWPIAYPGDSSGAPKDVYNCRCTLIGVIPGLNDDRGSFKRRAAYYVEDPDDPDNRYKQYDVIAGYTYQAEAGTKSYAEWLNDKMGKAVVPVIEHEKSKSIQVQHYSISSVDDGIRIAESMGVRYAVFKGMKTERIENILDACGTLPKDCRPVFVGNGAATQKIAARKLGRSANQWYGVTFDYSVCGFNAYAIGYPSTFDYGTGQLVGINTSAFKTLEDLTTAKIAAQESYKSRTGREWFFNTDGAASAYHEMAHCYQNVRGLPDGWDGLADRWYNECKCDMLKNPSEAFSEAYAAVYTNGRQVPDYIRNVIEELE